MQGINNVFYKKCYSNFVEYSQNTKIRNFKFIKNGDFAFFPHFINENVLYGLRYSGICTNSKNNSFIRQARKAFLKYCKTQNIRKFQIRNDPFLRVIVVGSLIKKEPYVYINLKNSKDELINSISKSHRGCIQKASREGLILKESNNQKYLKIFYKNYIKLMERKNGTLPCFSYFLKLFACMQPYLSFVYIRYKKQIIAVSIILKSGKNAYMIYGSMNGTGYKKFAKHFMIYNLIFLYKQRKYNRLILGTGVNGKDTIYQFKRGFSGIDHSIDTYAGNIT